MYCVMWTYEVPFELTEANIEKLYPDIVDSGTPDLIKKYFFLSDDSTSVLGIYIWTSKEAADKFYSLEWLSAVVERWGTEPTKNEWPVPIHTDSKSDKNMS